MSAYKGYLQKLRVNVHVENPLKAVIKSKYYMAYEYATILTEKIHLALNYGFPLEDEIAYIALHLKEITFYKSQTMKRKILIICDNGVGTSVLLKDKIENQIPELDVVDTLPCYMLENYSLDHIDFIISTRSSMRYNKKVIVVSPLLSEEDLERIHRYMKNTINISYFNHLFNSDHFQYLKAENKGQVLDILTSRFCGKIL